MSDQELQRDTESREIETESLSYSPMATELAGVLESWMTSAKDKKRIRQICQIADRSAAMVFSNPDSLRSFLAKFALTSDLLEAACLQLFGFQPTGLQHQSPGNYPPQGGYGYPPTPRSEGGGITHSDLERRLQDTERKFEQMIAGAIESALKSAVGERIEEQRRDRDLEVRLSGVREVAELKSGIERLSDKFENLRNGGAASDPAILAKFDMLQSRFDDMRRQSEEERRLEERLTPIAEELTVLKEKLTPSRTPAEYEVKSANLQAVVERAGASMDQLTALLAKVGVPSMMGQLTNQLMQMGIPSEEIPQIISAMMSSQTPAIPAKTSGLSSKIDQARSRWIRQSPPPAAQTPEPAPQMAAEPESQRWPGEIRRAEGPKQQLTE